MKVTDGRLPGVKLLEPTAHRDRRGFFLESYNQERYAASGMTQLFIQDNHSLSSEAGVIRGLHYQLEPHAQTKLVRVTAGAVFDVVVDLRTGSPTFGQWEGFELSAENMRQLLVPRGFAHGFCTLAANTEVQYKVDALYSAAHDRGIAWNDPAIGIVWPMGAGGGAGGWSGEPILSEKDARHPLLAEAEINFLYER